MDPEPEGKLVSISPLASSATDPEAPGSAREGASEGPGPAGTAQEDPAGTAQEGTPSLGGSGAGPESVGRGGQTQGERSAVEAQVSADERDTAQDLLSSLWRENSELRSLQMELSQETTNLSRTKKLLEQQLQSTSTENMRLKKQVDALQQSRIQIGTECGATDASMADRALTAEQEARCAKAQLALLMEKYDRIERDNQAMADEIHRFREQIGRLQQCPSQGSSPRSRYVTLGLSFLLGLAYFWFYLDELL